MLPAAFSLPHLHNSKIGPMVTTVYGVGCPASLLIKMETLSSVIQPRAFGIFPGIRYAGRLVADPLNNLGQGEGVMFAGAASQTSTSRWGDYSMTTADPSNNTDFWHVNEYSTGGARLAHPHWKIQFRRWRRLSNSYCNGITKCYPDVNSGCVHLVCGSGHAYAVGQSGWRLFLD